MPKALPIKERILANIRIDENECWRWLLRKDREGYGRVGVRGEGGMGSNLAHRVAYAGWKGQIPDGLTIDHLCRVRDCVNPAHLEAVTIAENIHRRDGVPGGQLTHCRRGHPYDAVNTYVNPKGYRECRTCNRTRLRVRYEATRKRIEAAR